MADYATIDKLLAALKKAKPTAEGRFKVNTWAMVLEAMVDLRDSINKNSEGITSIPAPKNIDVDKLTENIKGQIKEEMTLNKGDEIIMF